MTKPKLPPADAWAERNIADWNTTTFRQYLYDRHRELYGLDYVGAVKRDCGMISGMIKQHDKATVKAFIDECFRQYKPSTQYPGINFIFMVTYMKDRILPRVLAAQKFNNDDIFETVEKPSSTDLNEITEWF